MNYGASIMTNRRPLPYRRACENFSTKLPGLDRQVTMTIGYYIDGTPGEVFVSDVKAGTHADAMTRDCAVLLSLCLQHGIPVETVAKTITREPDGAPSSVMGVLIDHLKKERK
jgi:hypothetical protein